LLSAALSGEPTPVAWRIQGGVPDPVRGPQNNGGLNGERAGYPLPGATERAQPEPVFGGGEHAPDVTDSAWAPVTLPSQDSTPGVAWYRTTVRLDLPRDQDVPVGLRFTDDPTRRYRVLIFVNGWNLGQYVNNVGPQHVFTLPQGILRHNGENTIALAVWSYDATGGLGQVSLEALGNHTTSITVQDVPS
jgi:hypothetical protein